MDKDYWRLKKREQRARAKGVEVAEVVVKEGFIKGYEYDVKKYPNREAWDVAMMRAERARLYAEKFPQFVRESDMKYQDVGWQYEHEGLPAVKKKVTMVVHE